VLATSLNLDGTIYFLTSNRMTGSPDNGQMPSGPSLADSYDYVMYGKVFKFLDEKEKEIVKLSILISFGGLLLNLKGAPTHKAFKPINIDERVYLLLKK
jgi:DNA-directed RNA polymerase I, II, and III subunit RPABC3